MKKSKPSKKYYVNVPNLPNCMILTREIKLKGLNQRLLVFGKKK